MKKLILLVIISLLLLNIVACTKVVKVYVCANGNEVNDKNACPTNKVAGVKKKDAEIYARNYVNAFFLGRGGRAQLVTTYLDPNKGDFMANFIVADKGGEPYETIVMIDGKTGQVSCTENCGYVT
ncbi:TPA: hypothetical protein HA265_03575 [Candidatus Woesearchaeota archaeon]|nr:hypothetical protein [Candidatus Woesearchaeota archaeon]